MSAQPHDQYAALLADGVTDPAKITHANARTLLARCKREELLDLAATALADHARSTVRSRNAEIEVAAMQRRWEEDHQQREEAKRAALYQGKYKHGSVDQQRGAVPQGCDCAECEEVREIVERHQREHFARMTEITEKFAADLHAEWTAELLAVSFAIDNSGETVTWGEATVEQHERRIAMLTTNAAANIEAAARHRAAVDELQVTGAANLAALVASIT